MITLPCYLLLRDHRHDRLLVSFNDPERGLKPNRPCYVPAYACRFEPVDSETGEIFPTNPVVLGDGLITLPDRVASALPELVACELEATRRIAAADKAASERQAKQSASAQRREHDRQLTAQRRRKP